MRLQRKYNALTGQVPCTYPTDAVHAVHLTRKCNALTP